MLFEIPPFLVHNDTTKHRYTDVNGYKAHYMEAGQGRGSDSPTILIIASQVIIARSYRSIATVLSKHYHVVVVEVPGCGTSASVARPWTDVEYADWTAAFMAVLDLDTAVVIGHSDSGAQALGLAVRHPRRVSHLILVDSIGANAPDSPFRLVYARGRDALLELQFSVTGMFHLMYNAVTHTRNFVRWCFNAADLDLTKEATRCTVPTLLAWGRRDLTCPLTSAARFYECMPTSSVYISEAGCHNWLIQQPHEFFDALRAFLQHDLATGYVQLSTAGFCRATVKRAGVATAAAPAALAEEQQETPSVMCRFTGNLVNGSLNGQHPAMLRTMS